MSSFQLRRKVSGEIIRVQDDPYDSQHHSWVDVRVNDEPQTRRLLVTQRFRSENGLMVGQEFTWHTWALPLLNFLSLNPVQDITNDFAPKNRSETHR